MIEKAFFKLDGCVFSIEKSQIKNPGSRGGKFYINQKGQVVYGIRKNKPVKNEKSNNTFHPNSLPILNKEIKKNQIMVYRTIFAESIDKINLLELGNHWTKFSYYQHVDNKFSPDKKRICKIKAIFTKNDINEIATKKSNTNYPQEGEVVIQKNTKPIAIEVYFADENDEFKELSDRWIYRNGISTGKKLDKWVENPID